MPRRRDPIPSTTEDTPTRQERTEIALALAAVDASIDNHTEELALQGGQLAALEALTIETRDEARANGRTLGEILTMLQRLGPKLDRLDEIDEIRGRVERVRIDLDRHVDDHPQAAQ